MIRRSSVLPRSTKPIRRRNPERQAKLKKRQAKKHRAYMASETRRAVDARADGRCEAMLYYRATPRGVYPFARLARIVAPGTRVILGLADRLSRCGETEGLEHHHKTYARYGGDELPSDMLVTCPRCHDYFEAQKPAGNRYTRNRTPLTPGA